MEPQKQLMEVFKFLIDGIVQFEDKDPRRSDWQTYEIDQLTAGLHTLVWRYTKLNLIPFT